MMATVLRKVGLASKGGQGDEERMGSRGEAGSRRPRSHPHDALVPCARVCDLVNVCARPERPHRPRRRHRNQMSLLQSLQLRLDLWTSTTGNLLDRSFARRFCNRKPDNELYRSNSFRFEKFDREDEGQQQVSLCDDYSLPVDFVNKRRAQTLDCRLTSARASKIELVEEYFDPKDSKPIKERKKSHKHQSGHRHRRSTNTIDGSLGSAYRGSQSNIRVTVFNGDSENEQLKVVERIERRPSPYYYSDLLNHDDAGPSAFKSYRKPDEAIASTSSGNHTRKSVKGEPHKSLSGLESYRPFSAKENFEPKQGGIGFYDFASGKGARRKHRVVEVKGNLTARPEEAAKDKSPEEETQPKPSKRKEYVKSNSLDVPSLDRKSLKKRGCKKSASLDIPLEEEQNRDIGDSTNRFRPIVPVKEAEEGIEGGDEGEDEETVNKEKKKSLRKSYHLGYRDCLTGAPRRLPPEHDFSPAELLQRVIASGGDSKSLLAACLAEWDAHARLMRPLTARKLADCAPQCVSSEDDDFPYSREPFPEAAITRGEYFRSQESLRNKELLKEPIPEGKDLGDEFIQGKKISDAKLRSDRAFKEWGIIVDDEGGFENWNQGFEEHSDSVEAYRIAKQIVQETEEWSTGRGKKAQSSESLNELDMSRRGFLYETAFDAKISRSDDDLDDLDRVTNHPVLHSRIGRSKSAVPATTIENLAHPPRPGSSFSQRAPATYSPKLEQQVEAVVESVAQLTVAENPTPPSTAPLRAKFSGHDDFAMNSIQSAPELPTSSPGHLRPLPPKSLHARNLRHAIESTKSSSSVESQKQNELILEVKDRPKDLRKHRLPSRPRSLIAEIKPRRFKFSSTESMATSSSGSQESIKSSTSEGNRSTSSSESHRSTSLSSHSSDSVANTTTNTASGSLQYHHPGHVTNNIHILSPISDKSSLEPGSETSENIKNNNSPEGGAGGCGETEPKPKWRTLQNKNLINMGLQLGGSTGEVTGAGSDSGISVGLQSAGQTETDLSELPFDMPKLRRRTVDLTQSADACTSGSATSMDVRDLPFDIPKLRRRRAQDAAAAVEETPAADTDSTTSADLRDLPFDMPKLRRRQRPPMLSEASSGQPGSVVFRPAMTLSLDLESATPPSRGLSLELERNRMMTLGAFSGVDLIDPTLPLEKQAWYHGAISRIEAEAILRSLKEGSYLVRNSESTRQDYSLSLKSARGFMHMRIQMDPESKKYILGQFSKPFDSIPDMIRHYSVNRLPIRGAEHMCLHKPVPAQLL